MRTKLIFLFAVLLFSCKEVIKTPMPVWTSYDESVEIAENSDHETKRMRYKLIQSKILDQNEVWKNLPEEVQYFGEENYNKLKPLILEQDIPTLQKHIKDGSLTYEKLTLWYLFRIIKFENNKDKTLHTIIALNKDAVKIAKEKDKNKSSSDHPIFGMPILLKDNINTAEMKTTAGAVALKDNQTDDAFIVKQLKEKGAIILGKVNLSEWAYFLCSGCPVGYSAVGGQTLNPYGRKIFETGGSSSGSGTSMAANYAVAAVGTETSGSILSPSSQNSVVGLKPTIGLLSRNGIVPISSTLDTPGPMTRSVIDNAIFLSALSGTDSNDPANKGKAAEKEYWKNLDKNYLKGLRLGANKSFIARDSLYRNSIEVLKQAGAEIIEFDPDEIRLNGFRTLLNIDMKYDLPTYIRGHAGTMVKVKNVQDVVNFNQQDSNLLVPYGQALFEGIVADSTTKEELEVIKNELQKNGRLFFDIPMKKHRLDAVLSINNYNAGFAAVALYPAMTVPMGYSLKGQPKNLTFIGKPLEEEKLLNIAYSFEQHFKARKMPKGYE